MTQTLIHIIPYSKHYTGITQNNSTYIPYIPPLKPPPKQYKYETSTIQTVKRPSHNTRNTNTQKGEQEQQGQVSIKVNEYTY
jgi:hypothetical protein